MIFKDIIAALNWILYAILTGLGAYGIKLLWTKVHKEDQIREKKLQNEHKDGLRKTLATVDDIMANLVPLAATDVSTPKGERKAAVIDAARKQLQSYGISDATRKMLSGSAEKIYQGYKAHKGYVAEPQKIPAPNGQPINVVKNTRAIKTHINQNPGANK